jgi:hypothetical protein
MNRDIICVAGPTAAEPGPSTRNIALMSTKPRAGGARKDRILNTEAQDRGVSARKSRALEVLSIGMSLPPTLALALLNHTQVWMWVMWAMGASLGALWSIRVRAWGFLLLHGTYFTLNIIGLARLLGVSFS